MIEINGQATSADGSLLEACRRVGADVPAFCHDQRLGAGAHCRACLVELDGRVVPACTTRARDGQHVNTRSERLEEYRRDLAELMLAEASPEGRVRETLTSLGAVGDRYDKLERAHKSDATHPYLRLNMQRCITCRLCERACADVQGQFVFASLGRAAKTHIDWGQQPFASSDCVSCGACAAVCPSGAISDVDRQRAEMQAEERIVQSTCSYCGVGCQLMLHVAADDVVFIEGAESPVNRQHLCVKGRYAHGFARHPDRLTTPLLRKDGTLTPVSWQEAIVFVAQELVRLSGRVAALSSSRCTNEENYLVQKWFRAGLGSHDVDCCARVCHAPSAAGMRRSLGTGAATNSLADIEKADLFLVCGSNTTVSHPVTGARIKQAVLAGAKLLVVDPRRTELAQLADVHLQLRPGSNVLLFNALAAVLVEEDLLDHRFLAERTEGFRDYAKFVVTQRPELTEGLTGIPAALVRKAARLYGKALRPMQVHGLGMTEHYQGSEGVMLLCNLALLVGAIGREGVGVNPLRGQNNVQGAADMGCLPDLLTGYSDPNDPAVIERFTRVWGRPLPERHGRTLPKIYQGIREGSIAGMFILGEDVVQTDPDANRVRADLASLELLVVQEIFLSETAKLAHVVLPGASFLEKDGTFTNGERRIQRVRKALEPPGEARADWQILCELMAATGYPQTFQHPSEIMDEIAALAPQYAGVAYARLDHEGLQWPVPSLTHPGTPILHRDTFPQGRAKLMRVEYVPSPSLSGSASKLLLVTGRALEHYNSGSMTRRSKNRELLPEDRVQLHAEDAARYGIQEGDRVQVKSAFGEALGTADISDEVAPGTLFMTFHFPESGANNVTSDVVDRLADCPEYKLTPVEIRRAD
ncbi:MAG: formate dehydrogenase subunit alpha [Polyangiaceae bacterium]|nr:formate dehydrogenase subunit alpha [Polyangiaceae bacterium]